MFVINIALFTAIVVPYTIIYIKKHKIAPASLWLIMEMMFFYGICLAPRGRTDIAVKLESFYVIACTFFIIGLELGKRVNTTKLYNQEGTFVNVDPTHNQKLVIWIIIVVSVLACIYLFVAGGINVFVQSLRNFVSDENVIYSKQRAQFFGVKGQGYIYQFRVVLLPLLSTFILMGSNSKYSKLISIPLYVAMVVFLLGTGQRTAFVYYVVIVVIYIISVQVYFKERILSRTQIIIFGSFALLFMIVLTISNGRVSGDGNIIIGAINSLVERILFVNQKTAISAFRYIDTQPIVWGYDWMMMLRDILPGQSGYLSVDRIVYYYAYGTYNGTGPPCLWGSAWYNFGIFGLTIFPLILGLLYHNTYRKFQRTYNKNKLYILIYVFLCVYMGTWTYGTPMTFFNNGAVTALILRWLLFSFIPRVTSQKSGSI